MTDVRLYRHRISLTSGTGPLMLAQADALAAAGLGVELAAARGGLELLWRRGRRVRRLTRERALALAAAPREWLLVDHGAELPGADVAFVHNVHARAETQIAREDAEARTADARVAAEAEYFRKLAPAVPLIANSELARAALIERYALAPERVHVIHPGCAGARFGPERRADLRARARRELGLADEVTLIGLLTSGDFAKRGLDVFLAAAARIAAAAPATRFLVVGSQRLPAWAAADPLLASGIARYRAKSREPELWLAALDLFLYPARFEEFGLVVAEALALGVPVLTSRRVGAAALLPRAYDRWLLDAPEAESFASAALELIAQRALRDELARASQASAARRDLADYGRESAAWLLERRALLRRAHGVGPHGADQKR